MYDNYLYNFAKKVELLSHWRCKSRPCKGAIITNEENVIITEKVHTCIKNSAKVDAYIAVIRIREQIKKTKAKVRT